MQAVYGSILGLLIAYTYELYGSFAAPVLFHGVANVSVYALTYQDGLADMDSRTAWAMGMVFFAVALFSFIYIKKKCV